MASSPSMRMASGRLMASARSSSVARTRSSLLSEKRRAVSFTMANASGRISSSTSSICFTLCSSSLSISS